MELLRLMKSDIAIFKSRKFTGLFFCTFLIILLGIGIHYKTISGIFTLKDFISFGVFLIIIALIYCASFQRIIITSEELKYQNDILKFFKFSVRWQQISHVYRRWVILNWVYVLEFEKKGRYRTIYLINYKEKKKLLMSILSKVRENLVEDDLLKAIGK